MDNEFGVTTEPRVSLSSVTFSDGHQISLSSNDIVVLVGPNNSGKSVALKEILSKATDKKYKGKVINEIQVSKSGTEDDLIKWLQKNCRRISDDVAYPTYQRLLGRVVEQNVKVYWKEHLKGFHSLADFFFYHLTTDARLNAANRATSIALTRDTFSHPIHYMQADDLLELKISGYFREAFGEDLIIHRNAGMEVPLHCGHRPTPREGDDRVSVGYLRDLESLPTLDTQGDGMRSFVGVLLHSLVVDHSVILIDEPEAFLHPPQARILGQMLVKEVPDNRQLIIATHSGDFLRGLLDSNSQRVRIVRVQRNGSVNPIKELDNAGIRRVWGDPILRYSNVLDGLFHSKVVVCEGDSDCRFYAAVMDALITPDSEVRREDTMFIHCGGKSRIPVIVTALRDLNVPLSVVCDFDIFSTESPFKAICESIGIAWSDIVKDWTLVKTSINQKKPELSTSEISHDILDIIKSISIEETTFPIESKKKIEAILRRSSPWAHAKTIGKSFVPSGESTMACERLLGNLERNGVFVVPVGELEGFCRSVGNHGPSWVNTVLEKDLTSDPELREARQFVLKFVVDNIRSL